jgi:hypothetical protein
VRSSSSINRGSCGRPVRSGSVVRLARSGFASQLTSPHPSGPPLVSHDVEGRNVPWAHDGEVTAVDGGDLNDAETFGCGDDGVGTAER